MTSKPGSVLHSTSFLRHFPCREMRWLDSSDSVVTSCAPKIPVIYKRAFSVAPGEYKNNVFFCDIMTHPNYCDYQTFMSYCILWIIVSSWLSSNDFYTLIGCSNTRLCEICPVQMTVWKLLFAQIISLRVRTYLPQTEKDIVAPIPTLTAFFTVIINMSPQWCL